MLTRSGNASWKSLPRSSPTEEIKAQKAQLARKKLKLDHMTALVAACQPNAALRATTDIHDVRVGSHIAPPSGPKIVEDGRLMR
jgi:hypothetical protein